MKYSICNWQLLHLGDSKRIDDDDGDVCPNNITLILEMRPDTRQTIDRNLIKCNFAL